MKYIKARMKQLESQLDDPEVMDQKRVEEKLEFCKELMLGVEQEFENYLSALYERRASLTDYTRVWTQQTNGPTRKELLLLNETKIDLLEEMIERS